MQGILLVDTKNPDQPEFTLAQSGSIVPTNFNRSLQLSLFNSSRHTVCDWTSLQTRETMRASCPTVTRFPGFR